ncbi:hypothetical protein HID58_089973 [Brassica napus]|uniref:(rape) hypothetical protein n=1 Tax=Brassica napus TaxID=3708 RepID=A0A816JET3_BRANA|nr:hypothetical protein HID58_089973 [Brassica napus]CAF1792646.1 unnamed protein product [Brassica napus]
MTITNMLIWRNLLFWFLSNTLIPGSVRAQSITLNSIEIFTKHDWFKLKHTPMTEISGEKCKRCGIYEQGSLISDKEFDEWELCPSDFSASQIYMHFKEKEINATFVCHGCAKLDSVSAGATTGSSSKEEGDNGSKVAIAIVAGVLCATLVVVGGVFMFRHSKRMKLQRDQARFMKLFEENDEPEDELGLEPVL